MITRKKLILASALFLQNLTPVFAGQADISVAGIRIGLSPSDVISIIKKQNPDLMENVAKREYVSAMTGEKLGISVIEFSNKKKGRNLNETLTVSFSFGQQSMYIKHYIYGKIYNKKEIIDAFSNKYNLPDGSFNEIGTYDYSTRSQFLYDESISVPSRIKDFSCHQENQKCNKYILDITYKIQDRPLRDPNTVVGYEIWIADPERASQSVLDFREAEQKIIYRVQHPEVKYEKPKL